MVDPRIQQAIANGTVPDGITAEYLAESRDGPSIIGIVFVTALTFVVVCTRLISRSCIVRRVGIDDALATLSLVRHQHGFFFIRIALLTDLLHLCPARLCLYALLD